MRKRITAALLLLFAMAVVAPPALAAPGGNGNGPHPTCPPNSGNPGGQPPCGGGGGGGGGPPPTCPPGSPGAGGPPPCGTTNPGYPPHPILVIDCLRIFGDIRLGSIPTIILGGHITLLSPPGCLIGGQLIVIIILSEPHVLGQATVLEDGSARIDATIPKELQTGTHNLELNIGGQTQAVRAVSVVPHFGQVAPASSRKASGSAPGVLALWALLILGGGAVLGSTGWRRFRAQHATAGGSRTKGSEVARIDTSAFVSDKTTESPGRPEEEKKG